MKLPQPRNKVSGEFSTFLIHVKELQLQLQFLYIYNFNTCNKNVHVHNNVQCIQYTRVDIVVTQ